MISRIAIIILVACLPISAYSSLDAISFHLLAHYPQDSLKNQAASTRSAGGILDRFSFGGNAGVGLFHGSLADYDMFAPLRPFNDYYRFGWRLYAMREVKWGIAARLHYEQGKLSGGRLPGKQSLPVDFETNYGTVGLSISYDLLNELFNKDEGFSTFKFYLDAELGIGLTFFRSLSYWRSEDGRIRDFVGYTVTDPNPPTQRYTADSKTKPAVSFNIPVGFTFGYRVNYKADITFSYTLNNLATDRLDTWDRDFSANDKYSYFGLGLRYNLGRSRSDYPDNKDKSAIDISAKERKWNLFSSKKENASPKEVQLEEPLEARKANPIDPATENDDLEEVRMKMFELQLKLFEMQYLLNGEKKEFAAPE